MFFGMDSPFWQLTFGGSLLWVRIDRKAYAHGRG
jgi:hypothetical protein